MPENNVTETSVSIVMPAYNEEEAIADAVEEAVVHILDRISGAELIVVNDGSKDNTGAILDELGKTDPRIHTIHKANSGHGPAIITGLANASGEFVFLIDSDRQIPLESFSQFWSEVQQGYDAVFGVRRQRDDPLLRIWLTRLIRRSIALLFGVSIYDANVPYKLLKRSMWEEAKVYIPDDTLAPSLFLTIYLKKKGYKIEEIDIPHRERETGEVSIKRMKLLKFCAKAFSQMWNFRRAVRHVG